MQVKGDPITDLHEDMAAEQKARSTYEYLIDLSDDPDVTNVLRFLREREIVHFQRFGEALRTVQEKLASPKFYMNNLGRNISSGDSCGCMNNDNIQNTCPLQNNGMCDGDCGCGCGRN